MWHTCPPARWPVQLFPRDGRQMTQPGGGTTPWRSLLRGPSLEAAEQNPNLAKSHSIQNHDNRQKVGMCMCVGSPDLLLLCLQGPECWNHSGRGEPITPASPSSQYLHPCRFLGLVCSSLGTPGVFLRRDLFLSCPPTPPHSPLSHMHTQCKHSHTHIYHTLAQSHSYTHTHFCTCSKAHLHSYTHVHNSSRALGSRSGCSP